MALAIHLTASLDLDYFSDLSQSYVRVVGLKSGPGLEAIVGIDATPCHNDLGGILSEHSPSLNPNPA